VNRGELSAGMSCGLWWCGRLLTPPLTHSLSLSLTHTFSLLYTQDLLTFAASDSDPHKFRLAEAKDVEPFLSRVRDPALRHALGFGVGIVTETMTAAERGVVDLLFESGAVQVRG
jgi:hypothetical protein